MKFEYNNEDKGECVAYIASHGELVIKTDEGVTYFYNNSNTPDHGSAHSWMPDHATRKFYRGDKITITF